MNLENIEELVYKENINLVNSYLEETPASYFCYNNTKVIVLDKSKVSNNNEVKECLTEELGHYYCNALYYIDSNKALKDKCELRAKKWSFSVLVPLQKLKEKLVQGFNLYELADYFDVDYNYMNECINFYTEKYGILV